MNSKWSKTKKRINQSVSALDQFKVIMLDEIGFKNWVNTNLGAESIQHSIDYTRRYGDDEPIKILCFDIMGYFGQPSVDIFKRFIHSNTKVRLLTPKLDKKGKDRRNYAAIKKMQDMGITVRENIRLHSRLFIMYYKIDDEIQPEFTVIGSFDFNKEGLSGERVDIGIFTKHPDVCMSAISHFQIIWDAEHETTPLE